MSHRRQWYAIRQDLKRKGLWRYAEAATTKKARTGGTKRKADPNDPDEGTSAGTGSEAPPAKKQCEYGLGGTREIYYYGKWRYLERGVFRIASGRKITLSGPMVCGVHFDGAGSTLFVCDIHQI